MSVKVDLDQLAAALTDFAFAYLITVDDAHHAHTVAVDPVFADAEFDLGPVGRTTRSNAAQHGDVTLLWPPREPDGYTLIVDGRAELMGESLRVRPTRAVLHRRATPDSPGASGCGDDCVPLA
jgi:hypothetical protein